MDHELFRVRVKDSERKLELRYRLDENRGWYALLNQDGVISLAYTSDELRPPTRNTALAIAELVVRRRIDDREVSQFEFVQDENVGVVNDPLTEGMTVENVLRYRGRCRAGIERADNYPLNHGHG